MGCSCSGPLPKDDIVQDMDTKSGDYDSAISDRVKSLRVEKPTGCVSFSSTASSIMGAGSTGSCTAPVYLSPAELNNVLEQPEFALDTPREDSPMPSPAKNNDDVHMSEIQTKNSDLEFPSGSGIYQTRSGRVGSLVADHLGIDGFNTRVMFKAGNGASKPEMRSYKSMERINSTGSGSAESEV